MLKYTAGEPELKNGFRKASIVRLKHRIAKSLHNGKDVFILPLLKSIFNDVEHFGSIVLYFQKNFRLPIKL